MPWKYLRMRRRDFCDTPGNQDAAGAFRSGFFNRNAGAFRTGEMLFTLYNVVGLTMLSKISKEVLYEGK